MGCQQRADETNPWEKVNIKVQNKIRADDIRQRALAKMRGREIDLVDFGKYFPQYIKETNNFKRYDDCNKSLNEYINRFMNYEKYRDRIRKNFLKPVQI